MRRLWSYLAAIVFSVSVGRAGEPAKTTLTVEGMTCGGCVAAVKVQLKRTEGVTAYEVSLEKAEAEVSYDPAKITPEKIAESVSKTGFKASVKGTKDERSGAASTRSGSGARRSRSSK
jgi:copper chaperone CopZ